MTFEQKRSFDDGSLLELWSQKHFVHSDYILNKQEFIVCNSRLNRDKKHFIPNIVSLSLANSPVTHRWLELPSLWIVAAKLFASINRRRECSGFAPTNQKNRRHSADFPWIAFGEFENAKWLLCKSVIAPTPIKRFHHCNWAISLIDIRIEQQSKWWNGFTKPINEAINMGADRWIALYRCFRCGYEYTAINSEPNQTRPCPNVPGPLVPRCGTENRLVLKVITATVAADF